jgi:transposase
MDDDIYILRAGSQWRYIPEDFPACRMTCFTLWNRDGALNRIHHAVRRMTRESGTRHACIIDSQRVKTA